MTRKTNLSKSEVRHVKQRQGYAGDYVRKTMGVKARKGVGRKKKK